MTAITAVLLFRADGHYTHHCHNVRAASEGGSQAAERNRFSGRPIVAPGDSPARRVPYHHHIRPSGDVLLYGYMTHGQEILDHCPENCHLPKAGP